MASLSQKGPTGLAVAELGPNTPWPLKVCLDSGALFQLLAAIRAGDLSAIWLENRQLVYLQAPSEIQSNVGLYVLSDILRPGS